MVKPYLEADDYEKVRNICKGIKSCLKKCNWVIYQNHEMKIRLNIDFGKIEAHEDSCRRESYRNFQHFASELKHGVKRIEVNSGAFAALKTNGQVITFGKRDHGAFPTIDRSEWEQGEIVADLFLAKDIVQVVSTSRAFAAVNKNGKVISWGDPQFAAIAGRNPPHPVTPFLEQIQILYSSISSFFAVKNDNTTLVRWTNNHHFIRNDLSNIEQSDEAGKSKRVKLYYKNGSVEVCF